MAGSTQIFIMAYCYVFFRWIGYCFVVAVMSIVSASPVRALPQECRWVWDCTSGSCKHEPRCDHDYDVVPPEPLELPPVTPLDLGSSPMAIFPPAGRQRCVPKRVCDTYGKCEWQTRC